MVTSITITINPAVSYTSTSWVLMSNIVASGSSSPATGVVTDSITQSTCGIKVTNTADGTRTIQGIMYFGIGF